MPTCHRDSHTMKLLGQLVALLLPIIAQGTQPRLMTVTLPLWYLGAAESEQAILIAQVPMICGGTDAVAWVELHSRPVRPDGAEVDINLISIYKLVITAEVDRDGRVTKIAIDTSKAVRPTGYPFTIEKVADEAVACMRREFPDKSKTKIVVVHDGEERSHEQPTTEQGGGGNASELPSHSSTAPPMSRATP